jgi:hypothetical protein
MIHTFQSVPDSFAFGSVEWQNIVAGNSGQEAKRDKRIQGSNIPFNSTLPPPRNNVTS